MPPKRKAAAMTTGSDEEDMFDEGELSDQGVYDMLKDSYDLDKLADKEREKRLARNQGDQATHLFRKSDQGGVLLKPDHASRPLWITDAGVIILESFSPLFHEAQDFLINIAEPVSRVSRMHEYKLTSHSLFAAVSVGHTSKEIVERLSRYGKTALSKGLISFIERSTASFGKAKLVLKKTLSYIESDDMDILERLMNDQVIAECMADRSTALIHEAAPKIGAMTIQGTKLAAGANQIAPSAAQTAAPIPDKSQEPQNPTDMIAKLRAEDDEEDDTAVVHSFQIKSEERERVIKRCQAINMPLTEEYDFNNDTVNPNLNISLKGFVSIRYYQEKALNKMFSNSRARSGIIVLPCGAGKTLVGVTAACMTKKSCMVLCTSGMSVHQWRAEFLKWSNINPEDIAIFTSEEKRPFPREAGIIITTYNMLAVRKQRSHDSEKMMEFIRSREWGLLICDEVHVVPAHMFKRTTYQIASHSKLGLTATLLREDDKIDDLNFLIGPKLYEANWQELSEKGHIARVQCAEVWCQMTPEFYSEWLKPSSQQKRSLLAVMNPRKFQACQFLIDYHEARGDKIIVFSDNVYALEKYARKLGKAYIYGQTPQAERMRILQNFQHNELVNTIFLSKIGDTSLDLPEATCLIQISSHYGSRRQEAQRLGRILRAKRRNDEGFNAFFYSLVSKDTDEMFYSGRRQAFLVDQGYAFKVITKLQGIEEKSDLAFSTPQDRRELLMDVLLAKDEDLAEEKVTGDMFHSAKGNRKKKGAGVRRTGGMLSDLSGGQGMAYNEYNKSRNKELKVKGVRNSFLRKLDSSHKNMKKAKMSGM